MTWSLTGPHISEGVRGRSFGPASPQGHLLIRVLWLISTYSRSGSRDTDPSNRFAAKPKEPRRWPSGSKRALLSRRPRVGFPTRAKRARRAGVAHEPVRSKCGVFFARSAKNTACGAAGYARPCVHVRKCCVQAQRLYDYVTLLKHWARDPLIA